MSCRHRQAEPVVLCTGETVACVCIECFAQLPAVYVARQRDDAELEAFCRHERRVELAEFGKRPADWEQMCITCGAGGPARRWAS